MLVLSNLYPQPSASAAGVRTSYLLRQLCHDSDWESVHYVTGANSTAASNNNETVEELTNKGVSFHTIPPNQSLNMKKLLQDIDTVSLVIFDRFYAEEAYSFNIYNHCPEAVRVVDMQDMHSLRQGRKTIVEQSDDSTWECITDALQYCPSHHQEEEMLLRELASLHRSDLTLVCSSHEYELLANVYNIPSCKLCMAPFWVSKETIMTETLDFQDDRRDFVFIGGFLHKPNVDAVHQLARNLWPRIRQRLPSVQLHIYGAYCPMHIQALHDPSSGFFVHGFAPSLHDAFRDKRVMLAPLRYGAGIKGKIIDAWTFGIPVVTTGIGSEGIPMSPTLTTHHDNNWGGIVANNIDDFVDGAICLYTERESWERATGNADSILLKHFAESQFDDVSKALKDAVRNRESHRQDDYFGSLLWHQTARSTEYFSRWIECKESKK